MGADGVEGPTRNTHFLPRRAARLMRLRLPTARGAAHAERRR